MNYNVTLNGSFSILGLLFILALAWGGYRGYKIGGIIMSVSLFALVAATFFVSFIAFWVYKFFVTRSTIPEVFGSITLGLIFVLAIWFSNIVHGATVKRVTQSENDRANKIVGVFLGILKYFIMLGVYTTILLNLDCKGHFLPYAERHSAILTISRNVMTSALTTIKMDYHMTQPCYPNDEDAKDFYKNKEKQKNNNIIDNLDSNKNNTNQNNNGNSLPVEDTKKP